MLSICAFAQKTHYEKAGVKLGKKIGRQVKHTNYERTPAQLSIAKWYERNTHLPTAFVGAMDGMVIGSLAKSYKYQNYYHGPVKFNYRKVASHSTDISKLEIANLTYANDSEDMTLDKDGVAQVYFDLINTGDTPLYGITPVLLPNKTKHIIISTPMQIDTLQAQSALRYVIEISGDGKRNPGKIYLMLRIRYGGGQYSDGEEIHLGEAYRQPDDIQ